MRIEEVRRDDRGTYDSLLRLTVTTDRMERSIAGTVFSDGKPRIVEIKAIQLDAEFQPAMLYVTNKDKPGFIGRLGSLLGERGINIATFALGRSAPGEDAIALIGIDAPADDALISDVRALPNVIQVKPLRF
jgi:D-3-phosphoglycerate dehydrogenase